MKQTLGRRIAPELHPTCRMQTDKIETLKVAIIHGRFIAYSSVSSLLVKPVLRSDHHLIEGRIE